MKIKKKKLFKFIYLILAINLSIINSYADNPLYKLNAIKLNYKDNNKIIIAQGEANAKDQYGREIYSDYIIYDKINNIIKTKSNSKYIDTKGNKIFADDFFYDLNLKKIKAINNVKYQEQKGNIFYFSEFEYFENSSKGFGKNAKGLLIDKSSFESKFVEIDNNFGSIVIKTKENENKVSFINKIKSLFNDENKYTTCENLEGKKNIKDQCPDWSLSTYQTKQDSNKKMVYHEHAVIKVRNVPIFYTPYFSHPDPTLLRKSGFLPPSTKNFTNLGRTYRLPYFLVLNDNSDLTFTPIFYKNENDIYLTEYRLQKKNSLFILDSSYSSGYRDLNKISDNGEVLNRTDGSRNHLFINFSGQFDNNILFGNNDLNLSIQRISQKNYLNVNQINTVLAKQDISQLINNLSVNSYKGSKRLKISSTVYENLSVDNPNTKYQYKIPYIEYNNFFKKFNQNISTTNLFEANNYNGDTKKIVQRNMIETTSEKKILKKIGLSNIVKTNTSNLNFYNENILGAKPKTNNELYATIGVESSLPLIKITNNTEETLNPKIFIKHTTGEMSSASEENKILYYSDLYAMDRLNNINNPETGNSVGYGIEYGYNKKNSENINYLKNSFVIGQVITDIRNSKMPRTSSLNEKTSNIVGNYNFRLNNYNLDNNQKNNKEEINRTPNGLELNYAFNISNDLNKILKNDVSLSYNNKSDKIKAQYYETHDIDNRQYVTTSFQKSFKNNINFTAGFIKNLELNYTESNFIEANYDSDCFTIGLNLSKKFYQNEDLKKSNNLNLFFVFKPFGKPISPDLSNLIND